MTRYSFHGFILGVALCFSGGDAHAQVPVTDQLFLWLDASDPDGDGNPGNNPANGADLSTWVDKAALGGINNAIAAVGQEPTYLTNNSQTLTPVVVFNRGMSSGDDELRIDESGGALNDDFNIGDGEGFSSFVVVGYEDNGGGADVFFEKREPPPGFSGYTFFVEARGADGTPNGVAGNTLGAQVNPFPDVLGFNSPADNTPELNLDLDDGVVRALSVIFDRPLVSAGTDGSVLFGVNGVANLPASPEGGVVTPPPLGDGFALSDMTIGRSDSNNPGGGLANGNIAEILIYQKTLSSQEQTDVFNYLDTKYSLSNPPVILGRSWNRSGTASWTENAHWDGGTIPNADTLNAILGGSIVANASVTVDGAITVKAITFANTNRYVVTGSADITLDADDDMPTILVQDSDQNPGTAEHHEFKLPVSFADPITITTESSTSLDFDDVVNLNGNPVTIAPGSSVSFNHSVIPGSGGTISNLGTLRSAASSSIGGDLTSTGALAVEIAGDGHSHLAVGGTANLEGTIEVTLVDGFLPSEGQTFEILSAAELSETGSGIELGTTGDSAFFSLLTVPGVGGSLTLSFSAVPEPTTGLLIVLAAALLAMGSRRRATRSLVLLVSLSLVLTAGQAFALPVGFDTSNLILHLDAQDASSLNGGGGVSDLDAVTAWNDLSGNNNHAASGGGDDDPHYAATSINGNPAIRFDHTQGDALAIADDASFNLAAGQSFTAVYVGTYENTSVGEPSPNKVLFDKRVTAGFKGLYVGYERRNANRFDPPLEAGGDTISLQTNGDITHGVNTRPDELAVYASPDPRVSYWISDRDETGGDDGFYFGVGTPASTRGVNDAGAEFVSTGPVDSTGSIATLGRSEEIGANSGVTASMGELILFGRELTGSEQAELGDFLSNKWGVAFSGSLVDRTWNRSGTGSWRNNGNWAGGDFPDDNSINTNFGGTIGADATVTVDEDTTTRSIRFANTNRYIIGGSAMLTIDADDDLPTILVQDSDQDPGTPEHHEFKLPVNFADPTTITTEAGTSLDFDDEVHLNASTVTVASGSSVNFNHSVVATGSGIDNQGTLGTVGDTPFGGDLTSTGTLTVEIAGTAAGEFSDFNVSGTADLGGTIEVSLVGGFSLSGGESFEILSAANLVDSGIALANFGDATNFSLAVAPGAGGTLTLNVGGTSFTDFDDSGIWDLPDLNLVLFNWQQNEASLPAEWVNQRPGTVGLESLNLVLFNWQQASNSLVAVPEPATGIILCVAASLLALGARTGSREPRKTRTKRSCL